MFSRGITRVIRSHFPQIGIRRCFGAVPGAEFHQIKMPHVMDSLQGSVDKVRVNIDCFFGPLVYLFIHENF